MAFFGHEQLILDRVENQSRHQLPVALQGDGNRKLGKPVQKIGGAVQGIDDPAMAFVWPFNGPFLFHHEAIAWPRLRQFLEQDLFGFVVRFGHEVRRAFFRDLQLFDFAEIARQVTRRLAGRGDHDIHYGGSKGHTISQR